MGRLRLHEREAVRALWCGHFEAWRPSGLTQREYCERRGLSLKSFGNWHGQLKREDVAGGDARWGRHPRLRHMVSPMYGYPHGHPSCDSHSEYLGIVCHYPKPPMIWRRREEFFEAYRGDLLPARPYLV